MLNLILLAAFLPGPGPAPLPARPASLETLRVVTTIPDLADVASAIGGDRVDVASLARGPQNIHAVNLQPSHLIAVRRADVFVQVGLSLEHAFVPGLLMSARNDDIEPGMPGFIDCSAGWEAIEVPEEIDRGVSADVHPYGNPHMNLDPRAGRHFARCILDGLVRVQPGSRAYFEERHAAYGKELDAAQARWEALAPRLRGQKVVTYHRDFSYFARAYGMQIVATVEAKPGVPPTARDLAATVATMKEQGIEVVLTAKWSNDKSCKFVAEKAGARLVEIPVLVGGVKGTDTWIGMMDHLHRTLADALAPGG